jgi:glyoxylase-like metal-dependent hydrolase (beta-lactamase superfamily II)
VPGAGGQAGYPEVPVEMPLQRLSEHVYYVQGKAGIATDNAGFISNAAAIVTDEGIVVVDALGSPALAWKFLQQLKTVTDKPVVKVIVTHYHADHIYGLQTFKAQGAEIVAPAGYRDYVDAPIARQRLEERRVSLSPWVDAETRIVMPDRVIDRHTTMAVGGVELALLYLGSAHSDGDLAVLVKNDNVLISGDLIFEGRVPFTGSADTGHWLAVLQDLDRSGLKALLPGHGPAASDPGEALHPRPLLGPQPLRPGAQGLDAFLFRCKAQASDLLFQGCEPGLHLGFAGLHAGALLPEALLPPLQGGQAFLPLLEAFAGEPVGLELAGVGLP